MSEVVTKAKETKAKDTVKIKLPRAARGEENFMLVSLNGKGYKIKYGEEVEIPVAIAEIVESVLKAKDRAEDYINAISSK